jgi:hypothetical protein
MVKQNITSFLKVELLRIIMEFLKVNFREDRQVVVDDHFLGSTNKVIELEEGAHSISLAAPYDYMPHEWHVILINSTVVKPIEVEFK